jgi:hypothetical protein
MAVYNKKHLEAQTFANHTANLLSASDSVFSTQQALKLEYEETFADLWASLTSIKEQQNGQLKVSYQTYEHDILGLRNQMKELHDLNRSPSTTEWYHP